MILNFLSSESSSLLTKEIVFGSLAAIGGACVLRGLWMEYVSTDEKRYESIDIKGFRELKIKEKRGEKWVMVGIVVEITVAVLFAALDVKEKHDINKQNEANDPRNASISYMYATALLQVKGTQFNDLTNWNPNHVALLRLCLNDVRHIPNFDWLDADTYKKGEYHNMFDSANRSYAIRFQSWGFLPGMGIKSKVKDLDAINLLQMEINFLPRGAEISGGGVELVANNLHKVFAILPQTDTNFPDGTLGSPYIVLATNWDNEMK
jgi:hypothetical protein